MIIDAGLGLRISVWSRSVAAGLPWAPPEPYAIGRQDHAPVPPVLSRSGAGLLTSNRQPVLTSLFGSRWTGREVRALREADE
jgi:hypothetical protein